MNNMKRRVKKWLGWALALALVFSLGAPALAAEGEAPAPQQPDLWAYEYFADGYALGLVDDNMGQYIQSPVTQAQLDAVKALVANKLALLGMEQRAAEDAPLVTDLTRGGVLNALYQCCADYAMEGVEAGPIPFLQGLGVVRGVPGGDLALGYPCTYQEAMTFAVRLIWAAYDANNAGSRGLLWKAEGNGNTLYLLGTIHVDRDNVYPFHGSLRAALASSRAVFLELDMNDQAGMAEFAAMQMYSDGTTLKDHISAELYAQTVGMFAMLGLSEGQVALYKPWALANTLSTLLTQDESTASAMAIDSYVNAFAVNSFKPVGGVETYALQGGIFDTLSAEYQEEYLASNVAILRAALTGQGTGGEDAEAAAAAEEQQRMLDAMMDAWKSGDAAAFETAYGKGTVLESDDELSARLFTDRDPNMIAAAARLLETEGENIFFLAVGAGHMVDPGGIVSGLRALGYTVEPVER